MDLQSMDANLIKYPVQTMFESMEVTINPHFMPINLEPFAIAVPFICLFPQFFLAFTCKAFMDQVETIVKVVVVICPHQRVGFVHEGLDEFHCQFFLFFHFRYLCTAGFCFPYMWL